MPNLARKPCAIPSCREYALPGSAYCEKHNEAEKQRKFKGRREGEGDSIKLYRSQIWKKMRAAQLTGNPLCAECLSNGIVEPATDCDHIVPHKGNMRLFFDRKNLQSLCHKCHSRKTAREDGGFGHASRSSSRSGSGERPSH